LFFKATINSKHYVQFILTPFIGKKKPEVISSQDSAMAYMAKFSMTAPKGDI